MGAARPASRAGAVERLVAALVRRGATLAVAESLTAGQVSATLAGVPGASAVLRGGVVAYAPDLKSELLGVDPDLLATRGPVDPDVARQMARGAARRLGATHGLATTGVAGPGASDGQPAGTVYVAAYGPGGERIRRLRLAGPRAGVRAGATAAALALLTSLVADEGEQERTPGR